MALCRASARGSGDAQHPRIRLPPFVGAEVVHQHSIRMVDQQASVLGLLTEHRQTGERAGLPIALVLLDGRLVGPLLRSSLFGRGVGTEAVGLLHQLARLGVFVAAEDEDSHRRDDDSQDPTRHP